MHVSSHFISNFTLVALIFDGIEQFYLFRGSNLKFERNPTTSNDSIAAKI